MSRLIIAEIKRYLSSVYYLIILIGLFLIHVIGIEGWLPFISWGNEFLDNINAICIVLSFFISLSICDEFHNNTIQNKIFLGYKKSQIYIAETVACAAYGCTLVLFDSLFYLLGNLLWRQEIKYSTSYLTMNTLIFMLTIGCVSVLTCSLSFLIRKRLITQLLLVFIAIFLIENGRSTVGRLTDYESSFVEANEETDPAARDLIENFSEELSETQRFELNMKITLSPYAQCHFASYITTERPEDKTRQSFALKKSPYHVDFIIADIINSIFIIFVSMNIIKKQNI